MKREWKPGAVAMVTADNQREPWMAGFNGRTWVGLTGPLSVDVPTTHRALVVIDPDDDEATEGHWRMAGQSLPTYRAALREFANPKPPKPDEPRGLGAVVEDAEGVLWTRFTREYDYDAVWSHETSHRGNVRYADIAAVRILSAGVTA